LANESPFSDRRRLDNGAEGKLGYEEEVATGTIGSRQDANRRKLFGKLLALAGLGITGMLLSQPKTGVLPPVQACSLADCYIDTVSGPVLTVTNNGTGNGVECQASGGSGGVFSQLNGFPGTPALFAWTENGNYQIAKFANLSTGGNRTVLVDWQTGDSSPTTWRLAVAGAGNGIAVPTGTFYFERAGAGALVAFDHSGNVGIGTVNPLGTLHVRPESGSTRAIIAQGSVNQSTNLQEWQNSGGAALSVIDANGNFGVGTAFPQSHLFVVDSTTNPSRGVVASQNNDGRQAALMQMTKSRGSESAPTAVANQDYIAAFNMNAYDGTSYLGGKPMAGWGAVVNGAVSAGSIPADLFFYTKPSGTLDPYADGVVRFIIASNGNIFANGSLLSSSDARLKSDIEPIDNALDKVLALNGVYFQWNKNANQPDGRQVGVIAQNVQEVLPEIVSRSPASKDYLSVDYTRLVPVLIQAMKEQQGQITEQQSTIQKLLERISTLELNVKRFDAS